MVKNDSTTRFSLGQTLHWKIVFLYEPSDIPYLIPTHKVLLLNKFIIIYIIPMVLNCYNLLKLIFNIWNVKDESKINIFNNTHRSYWYLIFQFVYCLI